MCHKVSEFVQSQWSDDDVPRKWIYCDRQPPLPRPRLTMTTSSDRRPPDSRFRLTTSNAHGTSIQPCLWDDVSSRLASATLRRNISQICYINLTKSHWQFQGGPGGHTPQNVGNSRICEFLFDDEAIPQHTPYFRADIYERSMSGPLKLLV